jgi:hypothetical protein
MATPLAFHPHGVRTPFGKAAGIEGNNAIGFPQLLDHFSDQHRDQWPVVPERGANEVLDDLSIDIDHGGNFLGIFVVHVGQQPLEVAVDMALTGFGLQRVLVRYDKIAQAVQHGVEHLGGHETVAQ